METETPVTYRETPQSGMRITFSDIAASYTFGEPGIPQEEITTALNIMCGLLESGNLEVEVQSDPLLPLIYQQNTTHPLHVDLRVQNRSEKTNFATFASLLKGKLVSVAENRSDLMSPSGKVTFNPVNPVKKDNERHYTRTYRYTAANMSDKSLYRYVMLEEKQNIDGVPYMQFTFQSSYPFHISDGNATKQGLHTLATFNISLEKPDSIRIGEFLNWETKGRGIVVMDPLQPHIFISESTLKILTSPLAVDTEIFAAVAREYERNTPMMFFHLMMQAATIISYDAGKNATDIPEALWRWFRHQTYKIKAQTDGHWVNGDKEEKVVPFLSYESILYELIGSGKNPWKEIAGFVEKLSEEVNKNPKIFWGKIINLALYEQLPSFQHVTADEYQDFKERLSAWNENLRKQPDDGLSFFCDALARSCSSMKRLPSESIQSYAFRIFHLIPSLAPYYDEEIPEGIPQQPEYYAQICYGYNELARERGSEPISALVIDKNGTIVGIAHNVVIKHPRYIHSEDIAINKAIIVLRDDTLAGCSIFVSAEPCSKCATVIREYRFDSVYACVATTQGGETRFGILSSRDLTKQGDPYGEPPRIYIGILEEKFRRFYRDIVGWKDFVE